jgi:hypothetical protein
MSDNKNYSPMYQPYPHPEIQDLSNLPIKMHFKTYLWKLHVLLRVCKIFDLIFVYIPAAKEVELWRILVGWHPVKNGQITIIEPSKQKTKSRIHTSIPN